MTALEARGRGGRRAAAGPRLRALVACILALPLLVLLAAGCGSSASAASGEPRTTIATGNQIVGAAGAVAGAAQSDAAAAPTSPTTAPQSMTADGSPSASAADSVAGSASGAASDPTSDPTPIALPDSSSVRLLITRDFGDQVILDTAVPADAGMTVMSLLANETEVQTGYGGGFVGAIAGLASTFGRSGSDSPYDWFYWVDGLLGDIGAGDYEVKPGQTVWWDYHRWSGAAMIASSLAAFPQPFASASVGLIDSPAASVLRQWLEAVGIQVAPAAGDTPPKGILAACYTIEDGIPAWVAKTLKNGARTGVFAGVDGASLGAVSEDGRVRTEADGVMIAVRNPSDSRSPVLLVLARNATELRAFLDRVTPADLNARVGLYSAGGTVARLPLEPSR